MNLDTVTMTASRAREVNDRLHALRLADDTAVRFTLSMKWLKIQEGDTIKTTWEGRDYFISILDKDRGNNLLTQCEGMVEGGGL